MMNTQEQARELAAQHRQHDEHTKDSMLNRAEAEVHNSSETDNSTQEQARELAAQHRQHDEHRRDSMLNRAKDEKTVSSDKPHTSLQ